MTYATRTRRPPRTLTDAEWDRLLKVSGEHRDGFRDHCIFSVALGLGLRESEIAALDVGDVSTDGRNVRQVLELRVYKRQGKGADPGLQHLPIPEATRYKLEKYLRQRRADPADSPLFVARGGARISTRTIRHVFRLWQKRAGFARLHNFHTLRHTAITRVRRAKDISTAQRFARHVSPASTSIYNHVSDQELADATKDLPT